jgi:hypothetical protein
MVRIATVLGAATLALTLSLPADAEAQGRGKGRDRDRSSVTTRDGIVVVPGREGQGLGQSPAFCRSGAGHPVHGRQWCLQQGFGLGRGGGSGSWGSARMGDIFFGTPRRDRTRELDRSALVTVLGGGVLGRLEARSRALGAREPLTGRWLPGDGRGHTLYIRAGGIPVAELVDRTGNGRVDVVLLNLGR